MNSKTLYVLAVRNVYVTGLDPNVDSYAVGVYQDKATAKAWGYKWVQKRAKTHPDERDSWEFELIEIPLDAPPSIDHSPDIYRNPLLVF